MILNALFTALSNFIITIAADAEGMMDLRVPDRAPLAREQAETSAFRNATVSVFFLTQFRSLNVLLMETSFPFNA